MENDLNKVNIEGHVKNTEVKQEGQKVKGPVAGGRMGCRGTESRQVRLEDGEQRSHRRRLQRSGSQTIHARPVAIWGGCFF